jgi:branched-subunit amino acid aminotransferase/4-amino-4-deoxychorismate lyase
MAGFEGTQWANKQFRFLLKDKSFELMEADDRVYAVSRSIHYGLFLAFEGIRFFCRKNPEGKTEVVFLNLEKNMERLRNGISFNLGHTQQEMVPSVEKIEEVFLEYLKHPELNDFLYAMAEEGAQGYFRPFTFDEDQSIGVTFPANPSIRGILCRYDRYLGEPFSGVVIPDVVRAVGINGTGCLKLGINYVMSIKAVDMAKGILPEAGAALLLDDRPDKPLEERVITEWDTSCCLFAFEDGTVVKIPESSLILPSITIQGICSILRQMGLRVEERDISYGDFLEAARNKRVVAVCSVGTAGILNRAQKVLLTDDTHKVIAVQEADTQHELYKKLGEAKEYYWNIYKGVAPPPEGHRLNIYHV